MLPNLARAFSASPAETAHVVSGFSVAYGLLQAFFGPMGDRIGKYRLIALTTLVCTLGAVLASSLNWLILARILTGASAAGIIPLSMAWIGDTVPYASRQATLARFLGGQIMGLIGGQFIGGLFADTLGWRWAFGSLCLTYLVVGALVYFESCRNPFTHHQPPAVRQNHGVLAQVAAVLREPWARVVLAVVFLEGTLVFGTLAFVSTYLHDHFGMTLTMAGGLMGLFGIGGLTYILSARHFVHRFGEIGLALFGGLLMASAFALLACAPSWAWAMLSSYAVGLSFYMLHNTLQTNATQIAPLVRGTAVSLFASAFFLGQSLGVVLAARWLAASGARSLFVVAALAIPVVGAVFARLLHLHHRARPVA